MSGLQLALFNTLERFMELAFTHKEQQFRLDLRA